MGLGSNLGDPQANLKAARQGLASIKGASLRAVSSLYLTKPQDLEEQPWFLNQAARLDLKAGRDPLWLLRELQALELRLGRDRGPKAVRFGPRIIDLDLLLFGELVMDSAELSLPHPRMCERAFVLAPLAELAPELVIPGQGSLAALLLKISFQLRDNVIIQP